jgi:hypothetical protein
MKEIHMNWISVDDRLPGANKEVLVAEDEGDVDIAALGKDGHFRYTIPPVRKLLTQTPVTHWMPLPTAPLKEG